MVSELIEVTSKAVELECGLFTVTVGLRVTVAMTMDVLWTVTIEVVAPPPTIFVFVIVTARNAVGLVVVVRMSDWRAAAMVTGAGPTRVVELKEEVGVEMVNVGEIMDCCESDVLSEEVEFRGIVDEDELRPRLVWIEMAGRTAVEMAVPVVKLPGADDGSDALDEDSVELLLVAETRDGLVVVPVPITAIVVEFPGTWREAETADDDAYTGFVDEMLSVVIEVVVLALVILLPLLADAS